ncbi:MAG: FN3 associated domain-containing protein [Tepidisphaeraceae bacterium]
MLKHSLSNAATLLLAVVLGSTTMAADAPAASSAWRPAPGPLMTRWAKDVTPEKVWPEYPRPQFVRKNWQNLNGLWDFAMTRRADTQPQQFDKKILVPFPLEAPLSGVGGRVTANDRLWYRRSFQVPAEWKGQRIILHFGAVDWEAVVSVNGKEVGKHQGGYDPFSLDITDALKADSPQELTVAVWDPTGPYPHGKQVLNPGGIMYTATSGIWQTVWLESVPQSYVQSVRMTPDIDAGVLRLTVQAADGQVKAVATDDGKEIATAEGRAGEELKLAIPNAKLWAPDTPFLYGLTITLANGGTKDSTDSYFAMRKISVGPDEKGITRMLLNNKFVFQVGPLDQGFWPDGLYTPPTDAAIKFDVEMHKKYGFNMSRKHVKVEPGRWYYWCDKLGIMVWQDMPSSENPTAEAKKQFELELQRMIDAFRNHPCIIVWTPFNEGWGQYDTARIVQQIKQQDPSRLVNNASGWVDEKCGDILDHHSYPVPGGPKPEPTRASVIGEYGGLGFNLAGHMWKKEGWGYQTFQNFNDLNARYEEISLVLLNRSRDPGISAGVYTQLTDVEVENNGLMTYDREVFKVDPAGSALALRGYAAPTRVDDAEQFIGEGSIELKSQRDDAQIRYTLDNSEPSKISTLYEQPVKFKEATTIKARAFWANGTVSRTVEYRMTPTTAMPAVKPPEKLEPGLKVSYYENKGPAWDKKLPDFIAMKPVRETVAKAVNLDPAKGRNEQYALKFEGFLTVPKTAAYVFHVAADDVAKLTIDGKDVLEVDYTQGTKKVTVGLEAGAHSIAVEHVQGHGGQELRIECSGPGMPRRGVPAEMLGHAPFKAP